MRKKPTVLLAVIPSHPLGRRWARMHVRYCQLSSGTLRCGCPDGHIGSAVLDLGSCCGQVAGPLSLAYVSVDKLVMAIIMNRDVAPFSQT